jgi:putative redox protein
MEKTVHKVNSTWIENLAFDSHIGDHTIRMDASGELGDNTGPSPKKLLLASLAGCTGMDVASLFKKMKVPFVHLDINIEADLTDEHPKIYSDIRIIYKVYGQDLNTNKVEKAVRLSQEKYCGVSEMLRKSSNLTYTIEYISA